MSDHWHRRSITLFEGPSGSTRARESAQITFPAPESGHAGALRVTITSYGISDHEYCLTVPPEEKDWLLLNLLREYWQRAKPSSEELRAWLDEREINYEDFGYWSGPAE